MSQRHDLGPTAQIPPGEGRNFDVAGRRVAVFRTRDGRVFATQAACPHRGGPLADGLVGDGVVVCPLHEWRFDLASGETLNGTCPLEVYDLTVDPVGNLTLELP
ncbi:MAG TPA: Rieske (2Fe-2S) protein [Polyangia bacterium]|jgi:nitrite reductase (NADH) small subunit|nr:Rieske (2Fe-2S) protein [Polyangia bacterium]